MDQTVLLNDSVTFTIKAASATAMTYQWRKDGVNIPGATGSTHTIANVQSTDEGVYSVRVTNAGGSVNSAGASLTVLAPPAIAAPPQDQTVPAGQNTQFFVTATGTAPLRFQWRRNGADLPGATHSMLALTNVQSLDIGDYRVVVMNPYGAITSAVATLVLQAWAVRHDGSKKDDDFLQATAVDAMGNVYVTGYTTETASEHDYVTLKYDATGRLLWRATYNGPANRNDQARALVVDPSGNVHVTGSSEGGSSGWDIATVKYDSNGNQSWVRRHNSTFNGDDWGSALGVDKNGKVFVTGASVGAAGKPAFLTISYNGNGNELWTASYASPAAIEDVATSLTVDSQGNILVTGRSRGSSTDFDYATVKYASNGRQSWVARYDGPAGKADVPVQVAVDAAQNVFVTGSSKDPGGGDDYATVKYSPEGVQLWAARYNGPANTHDRASALALDTQGNVFVTGSSQSASGKLDYATLKYSPLGVELWSRRYDGSAHEDDQASALALDPAGDVYVTGASQGVTGYDYATVKYLGVDGTEWWAARFNSASNYNDVAVALAVDNQFNVHVGGRAFDKLDYTLVKYQHQAGVYRPEVVNPPQSQSAIVGQDVTFLVTASGTTPLSFQWFGNGALLSSQIMTSLTLSNVQAGQAGNFWVVITNVAGAATSAVATLTILTPPTITTPPQSQTALRDETVVLSVTALGSAPLSYQWHYNSAPLAGATGSSLTLVKVQAVDAGDYSVVVTNVAGAATSAVATLTVHVPARITTMPESQMAIQSQTVLFSVEAVGTAPLGYQWHRNGAPLIGATESTLTLSNLQTTDAGDYTVVVTNVAAAVTSLVATLTVNVPPAITTPPQSQTAIRDQTVVFSVTAVGTPPLSHQWRFNGTPLVGATQSTLTLANVQTTNIGDYTVVVTNIAGAVTSPVAILTVNVPPRITTPPLSQTVNAGQTAVFNVAAIGTAPRSYQWQHNGAPLAGATASTLTLPNVQTTNAGDYGVVVTNVAGAATSAVATLTVNVPPTIITPPPDQNVFEGQSATFTVTATGTAPLDYQWQRDGILLAGATTSSLMLDNVQPADAGSYTVTVANKAGTIISAAATLTVAPRSSFVLSAQGSDSLTRDGFTFQFSVPVGSTYVVLASLNLNDWVFINTNVAQTGAVLFRDTQAADYGARFYRVMVVDGSVGTSLPTF